MDPTEDEKETEDPRDEFMRPWHEYGKAYGVLVPDEQPNPHQWDCPVPEPDEKGTLDQQTVKHWRYFEQTRDFLRERYAEYGILAGPRLSFDCLVPAFQKPPGIPAVKRKQYRLPKGKGPEAWYQTALKMLITPRGEVGFVCNSEECLRTKCKLNLRNEKRLSPYDVYRCRTNQYE